MERYQTIEDYVATQMVGKIEKRAKSPLPGLLTLATGIALLSLMRHITASDSLQGLLFAAGVIMGLTGLSLTILAWAKLLTYYRHLTSGSPMRSKKRYLTNSDYKQAVEAINAGRTEPLATLQPVPSSNHALSLLYSRDYELILIQAGHYETGQFEPETAVMLLEDGAASSIQHLCK